jgi:hypothetical protein
MITLDQIVNSNLEMLKSQEAELLKSLSLVQKAKQLFKSENGSSTGGGKKTGRPATKSAAPAKKAAAPKKAASKKAAAPAKKASSKASKSAGGSGKETRLSKIIAVMKQKGGPIGSGDLIQTLFKSQKEDKNFPHFRQLVYTTLTQAFKRGIIKRKGDKLQLG